MPAPSLLSLVFPATSISPRGSPTKAKTQSHSHSHFLPFHKALASPLLHASSSSSSAAGDELHLLDKPSPSPAAEAAPPPSPDEALAPFLKFFRAKGTDPDAAASGSFAEDAGEGAAAARACAAAGGRGVRWYDPKPGDLVAGVVVGCDGRTLDVDVGAGGEPALMLTKEAVPLCGEEFGYLACDVASKDAGRFAVEGKVGIVVRCGEGEVVGGSKEKGKGAPVVGIGTVVFAEVLGRTLGGRPLLSARRLFRRVAWHRVRQIKQLNVPIEVKIFEWNSGGLLSRIEGLRAFLPKAEMMTRPRNFTALKNNVGRLKHVCITRIDERTNELIISEKVAWEMTYLQEGTLLQGIVRQLFPYGAQIMIGETNRSGLLHISNISHGQLTSISDVLKVDEKVKVLVVKSRIPDKIALSIKDLESEPGLFLSNREKVFSEAEEMAQKYREQIPEVPGPDKFDFSCCDVLPFDSEAQSYANWKWLKFRRAAKVNCNFSTE